VVVSIDSAQLVWDFLKTNALATDLRALVVSGADNVLEAGDVTESVLAGAVSTRRDAEETDKVLTISVQDAGERPAPHIAQHFFQFVSIRVYDRARGYRNLRTARMEIMSILSPAVFMQNLAAGQGQGILSLSYNDRTGYRYDMAFAVGYEVISYAFRVVKQGG